MKTRRLLKYFVSCGAIIYTVGSALVLFVALLTETTGTVSLLQPKPFLLLLAFAYVISLANTLFKVESISTPIRRLIHASLYILGLFAFLMLCSMEFYVAVIVCAVFGVIYALIVLLSSIAGGKVGRLNVSESPKANIPKKVDTQNNETAPKKESALRRSSKQKNAVEKTEYKNRFS
ncbi:MAG: hypothetical protein J6L83_00055 [Clostridia bacterium]|nr:hypothetical protein [Clostridia bacterium]